MEVTLPSSWCCGSAFCSLQLVPRKTGLAFCQQQVFLDTAGTVMLKGGPGAREGLPRARSLGGRQRGGAGLSEQGVALTCGSCLPRSLERMHVKGYRCPFKVNAAPPKHIVGALANICPRNKGITICPARCSAHPQ